MNTVLITGAGHGIGYHLAHRMAELGWYVIPTVHNMNRVEGNLPMAVREMDVSDAVSIQIVANQVARLDVLINNAIFKDLESDNDVLTVPLALVRRSFDVNTAGPLRVAQAFVPALLRSKAGRIINVSSIRGQVNGLIEFPSMSNPAYCISKAGLNMVTTLLAAALKDKGISVNSVCPHGGRNMEESVEEIVWAATELPHDQTGNFYHCRKQIPW